MKSANLSTVHLPVLPPNIYLQYLQVKAKYPHMSEFEALKLAYQWDKDPPSLIKKEIDSPVHMSQKDINKVLTTLADS